MQLLVQVFSVVLRRKCLPTPGLNYSLGHMGHTNSGFLNLWKHCCRFTHASFQTVHIYMAYRYQQSL